MAQGTVLSGKIAILPLALVNRIAAGEVIERPTSVVKELLENSIDAGSTQIQVEVRAGGRLLIRVQDDGEGMCREDALLAFQRHATSKLRTDQDLLSLQTLGFRGEALPSIAAVSKIRMLTLPQGGNVGTELILEGGCPMKVQEAGTPPGTMIEVKEIFYNTPARLKFLKTVSTELGQISRIFHQQALAQPKISFRLSHDGKLLEDLPAVSERMQRVQQVYGRAFADHLIELEVQWANIKVGGVVSKPPHTKGTRSMQEIFVNRRAVSCPFILHAVYEGYDLSLMKGQHPVVLLFLEVDGLMLDVNVHPAKREVRFHNQKLIYDLIRESVKTRIEQVSRAGFDPLEPHHETLEPDRVHEEEESYRRTHRPAPGMEQRPLHPGAPAFQEAQLAGAPFSESKEKYGLPGFPEGIAPLGQVHNTYILASVGKELWIIDQHAAHERVLYERFQEEIRCSKIPIQRLLIPQTLELPMAEAMLLREWSNHLESVGIEIESFGPRTLAIRAVPTFLVRVDLQGLMMDLIDAWINLEKTPSAQDKQNGLVATLACHAAVKANEALTLDEMKALLTDIMRIPEAISCPHGRPLKVRFTLKELEVMFRR